MEPHKEKPRKDIFTLVERKDRTYFVKSGAAFKNQDDSWNIVLDSLPVNGKLHMRDPLPPRDAPQALFPNEESMR